MAARAVRCGVGTFPGCDVFSWAGDGSRDLIEHDDHRAALFWIAATYARCMVVFHHDGEFESGFRALLADLGVPATSAIQAGQARVCDALPHGRRYNARESGAQ